VHLGTEQDAMTVDPEALAELIVQRHLTVAVAESLTGGMLSSRFAQAPGASEWFRGGIVAYASEVKHDLLGVGPGPVVSRQAAIDMVNGVAKLLDASSAIAVTGVGGPGPQDDQPPGTVWVGVLTDGHAQALLLKLAGSPAEICRRTCDRCLELFYERLEG
jgi:nicotinamide-nucleotide amidase